MAKKKPKIYIKPSKRGTFTAAAKRRGKGVQAFASQVLANKDSYSPAMVKKANFARNAAKWKKEFGGTIPKYLMGGDIYADNSATQAGIQGVSAINPVIGGIASIGESIVGPIEQQAKRVNQRTGEYANFSAAKSADVIRSGFDPYTSGMRSLQDPGASFGEKLASFTGLGGAFSGKRLKRQEEVRKKEIEKQRLAQLGRERLANLETGPDYQPMFKNGGEIKQMLKDVPFSQLPLIQDPIEQSKILYNLGTHFKDEFDISKPNAVAKNKDVSKFFKGSYKYPYTRYSTVTNKQTGESSYIPVLTTKEQKKIAEERGLQIFQDGGTSPKFTALDERVFKTVSPRGYSDDLGNIFNQLKGFVSGEQRKSTGDVRDELFKYALGSSDELQSVEQSPYRPSSAKDSTANYLRIKNVDKANYLESLLKGFPEGQDRYVARDIIPLTAVNRGQMDAETYPDPQFAEEMSKFTDALGNFTIGRGEDEKGKYVSIYDKWDLANPLANAYLDRIPEIYDRIYYTEDEQGNPTMVPEEFKNGGMKRYQQGGLPMDMMMGMPNAELEGGESLVTPEGADVNVEGPSHANGGVDMSLQPGTRIFSDHLKKPGTGKTYSTLNKRLTNKVSKYEDALDDPDTTPIGRRTAQRMLGNLKQQQDDLFVDQERLKIKKEGFSEKRGQSFQQGGQFLSNLASAAPALYNIGQGLFGQVDEYAPSAFYNVEGQAALGRLRGMRPDVSPQLEAIRRSNILGRRNLASTARTRGELLAGIGGLEAARGRAEAQVYSSAQDQRNMLQGEVARLTSQLGESSTARRLQLEGLNRQAREAKSNLLRTGVGQLGQFAQQLERRRGQERADQQRIGALETIFSDLQFDPQTGKFKYTGGR